MKHDDEELGKPFMVASGVGQFGVETLAVSPHGVFVFVHEAQEEELVAPSGLPLPVGIVVVPSGDFFAADARARNERAIKGRM